MPKKVAAPKSTGGGGSTVEGQVAAWYLLHMLAGIEPFDGKGTIRSIRFQARVADWDLDDLLLELSNPSGSARAAISSKSSPSDGVQSYLPPKEFLQSSWEQYLKPGLSRFDPTRDVLVLAQGPLEVEERLVIDTAIQAAQNAALTPIDEKILVEGFTNEHVRTFFRGFAIPEVLPDDIARPSDARPSLLLRAVRIVDFDFERQVSARKREALWFAREMVLSGSDHDALKLWEQLCAMADEWRPKPGGTVVDLHGLVDELHRRKIALKEHPNHRPHWDHLQRQSAEWLESLRDTIGGVQISRAALQQRLDAGLQERMVIVAGESGSGKSVLAKLVIQGDLSERLVVCADAQSLVRLVTEEGVGEISTLEALAHTGALNAVLVLDSAENCLADQSSIQALAQILRALRLDEPASPWHILLTVTSEDRERLISELRARNVSTEGTTLQVGPLDESDLEELRRAHPKLSPLLLRPELHRLTTRPIILQMLVEGESDSPSDLQAIVGEASLIEWFWRRLTNSSEGHAKTAVLTRLATHLANQNRSAVGRSEIESQDMALLADLRRRGILYEQQQVAIRFSHDIYGDYARQRYLLERLATDPDVSALQEHATNRRWAPAFRLLGLHLLELGLGNGPEADWQNVIVRLQNAENPRIAEWMREAIWRAVNPGPLLDIAFPGSLVDRAEELRGFLTQFRLANSRSCAEINPKWASASIGTRRVLEDILRFPVQVEAVWRPVWEWVISHRSELPPECLGPVVDMARLWIGIARLEPQLPLAEEVDDLVLHLTEQEADRSVSRSGHDTEARQLLIKLALSLGDKYEARVKLIAEQLSGLAGPEYQFSEQDLEPRRRLGPRKRIGSLEPLFPNEVFEKRGPWPGGPLCAPDKDFQKVVLEYGGAACLVELDPKFASRIFFAILVDPPHVVGSEEYRPINERFELQWGIGLGLTPFHDFAPVQELLENAPDIGLEFVLNLVNFATDRWAEEESRRSGEEQSSALGSGIPPLPPVTLDLPAGTFQYLGNERVFGWRRGESVSPFAIQASLNSLEQWLYTQAEQDQLDPSVINRILSEGRSVALLGVLTELALKEPMLLFGPLESLVQPPQLYWWIHTRFPEMGVFLSPHETIERLQSVAEWRKLPHRNRKLLDVAAGLFVQVGFEWPALVSARQRWMAMRATAEYALLDGWLDTLIAAFDPSSWHEVELPDGRKAWMSTPPREIQDRQRQYEETEGRRVRCGLLPFLCMQVLKGEKEITEHDYEAYFALAQEARVLVAPASEPFKGPLPDAPWSVETAVGTLGILKFGDWLRQHAEAEQQCWDWILGACFKPPFREERTMQHPHPWDFFAAYVLTEAGQEISAAEGVRQATGLLLIYARYTTLEEFFRRLAVSSTWSGDDKIRLLHLGVWLSRFDYLEHLQWGRDESPWKEALSGLAWNKVQEFAAGTLELLPTDWTTIATMWPEGLPTIPDDQRNRSMPDQGLDLGYLAAMWTWLKDCAPGGKYSDRDFLLASVGTLAKYLRSRYVLEASGEWTRTGGREFRLPHEPERVILGIVAAYMTHEANSDKRMELGGSWLSLPARLAPIVEAFLMELNQAGWVDPIPAHYADALQDCLQFAGDSLAGDGPDRELWTEQDVASALLGGRFISMNEVWGEDRRKVAEGFANGFRRWAQVAVGLPGLTAVVLRFLTAPAAQFFRVEGLSWLTGVEEKLWDEDLRKRLVRFLEILWEEHRDELTSHRFEDFIRVLSALCDQSDRRALLLRQQVNL